MQDCRWLTACQGRLGSGGAPCGAIGSLVALVRGSRADLRRRCVRADLRTDGGGVGPGQQCRAPAAGKLFSSQELDELVARVALYPDPLLALVLPASTNPIQLVQAARFLDQNTGDQPPESWDPAIISLCNYPEVVEMMSGDLEWTQALGDAVATQQADVMDSVQQVRAEAQAAGNLQTSEQQKVIVEKEVVKIVPADPQVIYVPQYDPQVIYLPSPAPVVSYYPPRPCYWCSAAAFGTGMFIGAATTAAFTAPFWAFDWHRHDIGWGHHRPATSDFDFDIDRDININNNITNVNKNVVNKGNGNQWKPDKNRPGNRPGAGNRPNRPNRPDGGWNNPNRPGAKPGRPGAGRPSTLPARPGTGTSGRRRGQSTGVRGRESSGRRGRRQASGRRGGPADDAAGRASGPGPARGRSSGQRQAAAVDPPRHDTTRRDEDARGQGHGPLRPRPGRRELELARQRRAAATRRRAGAAEAASP